MNNPERSSGDPKELRKRIKIFVVRVMKLTNTFPKTSAGYKIGGQVVDSAGSVGANFSEAQAARSKKEFISTLGIVLKEAMETNYWLEIIKSVDLTLLDDELSWLIQEGQELEKIFAKIIITAKHNK